MSADTLLLDAGFLLVTGLLYIHVGRVTMRRQVAGEGALAAALFGVFWLALGALQFSGALTRVLGAGGFLELPFYVTLTYVALLVLCIAVWALTYYLFYLLVGTRRILVPLTAFYVAFYAFLLYIITYANPTSVIVEEWRVRTEYSRDLTGTPMSLAAGLLLLLPPLIGAAGYSRLFFKVQDPTQRYRIGLVSLTILAWFSTSLIATLAELNSADWWQFASRGIGLCAAILIHAAFRPPAWVRRRWGVRSIDEATAA